MSVSRPQPAPLCVAIIGGGFTGAALAIHLARAALGPLDIEIVEPAEALGAGHAYGACDPLHRINVPSDRMSLFASEPKHATDWLFQQNILPGDGASTDAAGHHYVARAHYGAYVEDTLAKTLVAFGPRVRLRHHRAIARDVRRSDAGWRIGLSAGRAIEADRVALCFGHSAAPPPCPVSAVAAADPRLIVDPWRTERLAAIDKNGATLLVGTGLTMADMVASLVGRGHRGKLVAVSRRGLLALPQGAFAEDRDFLAGAKPPSTALGLLRLVRLRARQSMDSGLGWHPAIDALRRSLSSVWLALPPAERVKVARRLLPFWDVHRFRVAPQPHAALAAAMSEGRLTVEKAGIAAIDKADSGLVATLRGPGGALEQRPFDAIVLCVGPDRNLARNPLVGNLFATGLAHADAVGLGLDVDAYSRVIARDGTAARDFFAFGPVTRGSFGEMTGAPDIARQIGRAAGLVAAAIA